ncbi:hypothetical protein ASE04_22270 [Rhizobium sp. Root708]|nr:hypothetical protein ASE04_22270 [Rhizobium sp. Root708]
MVICAFSMLTKPYVLLGWMPYRPSPRPTSRGPARASPCAQKTLSHRRRGAAGCQLKAGMTGKPILQQTGTLVSSPKAEMVISAFLYFIWKVPA